MERWVTPDGARHEFVDHTSELALRVSAATPAGVFGEACRALGALMVEEAGRRRHAGRVARTVAVDAVDADALLVDLLNELIYLAETERWAPTDVIVEDWTATRVVVHLAGPRLAGVPSRIKSATHHGLGIKSRGPRWEVDVVLDI